MRNGKIIIARLWPYYSGGLQSRAPVAMGVNPEKYETIIIYLIKSSSNPNIFEQRGKKVFYLAENVGPRFLNPFIIFKLVSILKNQGVDILHCHMHKATVYGVIAAKIAKTPVILSHVHGIGRTRNFRRRLSNRFLLPQTKKILTVGQVVKEDVLKSNPFLSPDKVINVGNSIDYDFFASNVDKRAARDRFAAQRDAFIFGAAGRLSKNKGQSYLIRAFAKIKKEISNAQLLIAGDGEFKNLLIKEADSLGCGKSVLFAGRINDMPTFYSAIDVFVQPSIGSEGLPRAILEAMAAGVPVIATDTGGIPEILDNGRFGQLIPAKDENALVIAMLKIANMPQQEKSAVVSSAKERVRTEYNHDVSIKMHEKIYEDCMIKNV